MGIQNGTGISPICYQIGTRPSLSGINWPQREADHSNPSLVATKSLYEVQAR